MCDTLAVVGVDGLLFAKNSDRPPDEPQVVEHFAARPAGGTVRTQYLELPDPGAAAFVGSRPTWLWGVEHGVNEHGVAIGNEKLYTTGRPKARAAALLGMDLVRLGLERGRSAEHAVEVMTGLIEAHGQGGSGERDSFSPYDSSFLVADATGGWIVETCDRTWAARPFRSGASVSNRISLGTDWTRASADVAPGTDFQAYRHPGIPTTIADHRLAATHALRRPRRGGPVRRCRHRRRSGTTAPGRGADATPRRRPAADRARSRPPRDHGLHARSRAAEHDRIDGDRGADRRRRRPSGCGPPWAIPASRSTSPSRSAGRSPTCSATSPPGGASPGCATAWSAIRTRSPAIRARLAPVEAELAAGGPADGIVDAALAALGV